MSKLSDQHCVPCEGGIAPYTVAQAKERMHQVPGWQLREDGRELSREFTLKDFTSALALVNRIGEIAEAEGHHPDLELGWGRVGVRLSTHAIKGLSLNDFILAAKINAIGL